MVMPSQPLAASRRLNSGSHEEIHESTRGVHPNFTQSSRMKLRTSVRRPSASTGSGRKGGTSPVVIDHPHPALTRTIDQLWTD
jgi:hypothetical protein